jgi:hypothetical protein
MDIFLILQILFDAVLLFGVLFLFHFSVNHSQKKKEESDILNNLEVQGIRENLQELLLTLKQLGKEVSENIQEEVRGAEAKTEVFKKVIVKLQKDLKKTLALAEEVRLEKIRLEEKVKFIQTTKQVSPKESDPRVKPDSTLNQKNKSGSINSEVDNEKPKKSVSFDRRRGTVGFSSGLVREVYRLVDENISLNEIIQRTQLSRAEVQLILNLRDNRFTTPN